MGGIDERVKVFLEAWAKRKAGEIPEPEEARCAVCGAAPEDGNFILIDGDLLCLKYKREETPHRCKEYFGDSGRR